MSPHVFSNIFQCWLANFSSPFHSIFCSAVHLFASSWSRCPSIFPQTMIFPTFASCWPRLAITDCYRIFSFSLFFFFFTSLSTDGSSRPHFFTLPSGVRNPVHCLMLYNYICLRSTLQLYFVVMNILCYAWYDTNSLFSATFSIFSDLPEILLRTSAVGIYSLYVIYRLNLSQ